jgi:hypothetical protein
MASSSKLPETFPTPLTTPCIPPLMDRTAHTPAAMAMAMLQPARDFPSGLSILFSPKRRATAQLETSRRIASTTSTALALFCASILAQVGTRSLVECLIPCRQESLNNLFLALPLVRIHSCPGKARSVTTLPGHVLVRRERISAYRFALGVAPGGGSV